MSFHDGNGFRCALLALVLLLPKLAAAETTVVYYHTDALGSPVATTDASGAVIERSEYEPYGKLLNRPLTDGPGYTGHVSDAATGLSYMQQRYYDPTIGRFLSVDPVTADSDTGDNFNRYWYANNNPYKFTDPDGRYVESAIDVALIVADAADIASNGLNWTNGASMAANIVGLAVPIGTGFGPAVRGVAAGVDAVKGADKAVDAGKSVAANNRAENVAKGIPESQLGPSGKPMIHKVQTSSVKQSKDAARAPQGKGGTAVKHQSPTKGGPHHHGVSGQGKKDRVHYEYPKSKK